jgi:S-adenosylmethionine:tRNA ribosyltransferase-isomerase
MYQLTDYWYDLPQDKIAQSPCTGRSESRLLHVERNTGSVHDYHFKDIASLLRDDDLLIINDARVIPARLFGKKATGGKVEVLIIDYAKGLESLEKTGFFQSDCLIKASRQPAKGSRLFFEEGVEAEVMEIRKSISKLKFFCAENFSEFLHRTGEIPLPPYIKRQGNVSLESDRNAYQTVYASKEGAVAAPTAGLHFTKELMSTLKNKGVEFIPLTLHVGYGTFVPVKVQDIRDHEIHSEYFTLSKESADRINTAKQQERRIVAVGTTSVRVLEYLADENGMVRDGTGMCDLFIFPGYKFKTVDGLITNFHLPESSLLMLVSAFYDREKILSVYTRAVEKDYRFFSYGDAMFIE